jgi:hypothetical protein
MCRRRASRDSLIADMGRTRRNGGAGWRRRFRFDVWRMFAGERARTQSLRVKLNPRRRPSFTCYASGSNRVLERGYFALQAFLGSQL